MDNMSNVEFKRKLPVPQARFFQASPGDPWGLGDLAGRVPGSRGGTSRKGRSRRSRRSAGRYS